MDEASAAKLEELHLGAVSEGEEWLRRALSEMSAGELRVLAAAGGVVTHSNRNWLPVAELRSSLMKVLVPPTEVGCEQKWNNMRQTRHHGTELFWAIYVGFIIQK